jgi:23S rRNA (guanosine2251-2'-O)-methyltransferase
MSKKTAITTELIYGLHPILELLKAKRRKLTILYTTKPVPKGFKLLEPLLPRGLQIQYVDRVVLAKLAGTQDHQSFVGYATPFQFRSSMFEAAKSPYLLMLDGVQDVRNLGAILRTAACVGVDGVMLTARQSAPITAAALKASAGLAEHLAIYCVPSPAAGIIQLKKAGYQLYVAVVNGGVPAHTTTYKRPCCIVIGSEGTGVSADMLQAGTLISLPQKVPTISYNASVAAGILLFITAYIAPDHVL